MSIGSFNTANIRKQTTIMLCVIICITAGIIIYSAICPPPGHIDEMTFKLVPWAFALCGLLVAREAIAEGLGVKFSHGDTHLEIKDTDSNENPA